MIDSNMNVQVWVWSLL